MKITLTKEDNYKIFTIGYQNITRKNLKHEIEQLDAALVDIRYVPFSRNPFWTLPQLQETFQDRYYHIKDFGNVNYKGGPFKILNLEKGMKSFLSILNKYKAIFLLCSCKNFEKCHRSLIAEEIKTQLEIPCQEFDI